MTRLQQIAASVRSFTAVSIVTVCLLFTAASGAPASARAQSVTTPVVTQVANAESQTKPQLKALEHQVDELEKIVNLVLLPIAVLIGILCTGGAIGVVFSVRDQRRVSQLHELSVSSEMSSQRRTDQSYNTFLEASQKTLNLVNDTLELAKEATDRAAHTMELKAGANLATIEAHAEDLILNIIETGDFEEVVDIPENRARLQTLASELGSLEGYLVLQDIDLHPYSRFIKGIEQFLKDDTAGALHTLRHAAQDTSNRQLQRFSLYWAAKLNNAVGNYDHALRLFEQAAEHINKDGVERYELDRAHLETEFFQIADTSTASSPLARFKEARSTLAKLEAVATGLAKRTANDRDQHANHEVAATRADIYTWIAHDTTDLCHQFSMAARNAAAPLADGGMLDKTVHVHEDADLKAILALEPESLRAWALLQAQRIYAYQHDLHETDGIDFSLLFGRAECHFALRNTDDIAEYTQLERKAIEQQLGAHREHRWTIELAQIALICKSRLLWHQQEEKGPDVERLKSEVGSAYTRVQDALHGSPDHTVLIFSHLQRRNLQEEQFRQEAENLKEQAINPSTPDPVPASVA